MSNWNYWKELPYRGEPPDNSPGPRKPKRKRNPNEKRRVLVMWIVIILGAIFSLFFFASDLPLNRVWMPALFLVAIILIPLGLNAGINALNRYLRADDLNDPKDSDKK
jgi:hypothetical protein